MIYIVYFHLIETLHDSSSQSSTRDSGGKLSGFDKGIHASPRTMETAFKNTDHSKVFLETVVLIGICAVVLGLRLLPLMTSISG